MKLPACLLACLLATGLAAETAVVPAAPEDGPLIEVAILLDTSGSMQGLIDQARGRIWSIVNDMTKATVDGRIPNLRIGLYEYGNTRRPGSGQVRQVLPLTDDLDDLSEKLFSLDTSGGTEKCGEVIGRAVADLGWSEGDHYKAIFIAGNEAFTQGSVDYRETCKAAVTAGIIVNTIHCGDEGTGRGGMWHDGAARGDGEFLNIDHNKAEVVIKAPQDEKLRELNTKFNATYVGFGGKGKAMLRRQAAQDRNAEGASPSVAAQRMSSKVGGNYRNGAWELVDAVKDGSVKLEEVEVEDLPEEMKEMSVEERKAHVEQKQAERDALKKEIAELTAERETFVAAERERRAAAGEGDDFGQAVRKAMNAQLEAKGYEVPAAPAPAPEKAPAPKAE